MSYLDDFFDRRKSAKVLSPEERAKQNQKNLEEQRQRAINYKKYFGEDHGKAVMFDLMNKYHVLSPLPRLLDGSVDPVAEGQRSVVLDLLVRANVNMEQLDRLLKGEGI